MLSRLAFIAILILSFTVQSKTLRVAVATNFYPALTLLKPQFEQQYQIKLQLISGSSGVFYAQIVNGAPFDVFLSADKERPNKLVVEKLTLGGSKHYATGKLAWWQPSLLSVAIDDVASFNGKVAIANPKFAPYGRAAENVIARLALSDRFAVIKGNSVGQALQFVDSGNADAGFVAQSQLLSAWKKHRDNKYLNFVEIPTHWYLDIQQHMVILKNTKSIQEAQLFFDYLTDETVQKELQLLGYR